MELIICMILYFNNILKNYKNLIANDEQKEKVVHYLFLSVLLISFYKFQKTN